jgi:hypothetical protein
MSRPLLYFAVPARSSVSNLTMWALAQAWERLPSMGFDWTYGCANEGGLPLARGLLATRFHRHSRKPSHMFFVDSDVGGFTADDIARIVSSGEDLVGAPIPSRDIDHTGLVAAVERGVRGVDLHRNLSGPLVRFQKGQSRIHGSLLEVEAIGTGFLCLSRACIDRMVAALDRAPANYANREPMLPLFDYTVNDRNEVVGEDYGFCDRWRAIGGTVWCDCRTTLLHVGELAYHSMPLAETIGIDAEIKRRAAAASAPPTRTDGPAASSPAGPSSRSTSRDATGRVRGSARSTRRAG